MATAGVALLVIGVIALGIYLYKRSEEVPTHSGAVVPCPLGEPVEPVRNPNIGPKPVPIDQRIPDIDRAREVARRKEEARKQRCAELNEIIHRKANRRRKRRGSGTQGMKYRYWDMICSEFDPSTPQGSQIWDDHKEAYETDRAGLQADIDEFEEKCTGDLPPGAKEYADKDFPDKSEWKGNSPECEQYRRERQERYDRHRFDPDADNG